LPKELEQGGKLRKVIIEDIKAEASYKSVPPAEREFLDYTSACNLFSVGRSTLNRLAKDANAIVTIGRMKRYDRKRLTEYFLKHINN
jgi:hypothetical protein